MPSILFHELVADKFAKKYTKYYTNDFYLGVIVPDAVNAYGFASKEKRWGAHFRDKSLIKWQKNVMKFYFENLNIYENTYLMGYVIHILTDILCDKIYTENLYPDLLSKGYDYDTAYRFYEKEIVKLENNNLKSNWWKEAKSKIQNGEIKFINNIDTKMIQDWINYTLNKYDDRSYEEIGYVTIDFANKVLEQLEEIFKSYNIILK